MCAMTLLSHKNSLVYDILALTGGLHRKKIKKIKRIRGVGCVHFPALRLVPSYTQIKKKMDIYIDPFCLYGRPWGFHRAQQQQQQQPLSLIVMETNLRAFAE